MRNNLSKRCVVFLMTLAMVLSIIPAIPLYAEASDDINNPGQYSVQLLPHETEYRVDMRPQIAGATKTIYWDKDFTDVITEPIPIAPGQTVYVYAKYVQDTTLPDAYTQYYRLRIIGRAASDILYLDKVAGVEIDPALEGGEGTVSAPFTARITVPNSQETIKHIVEGESDLTLRGGTQGVAFTHSDDSFSLNDQDLANRVVPLVVGENKIYVSVWSGSGSVIYYYVITVIREANQRKVTYKANEGIGTDVEVAVAYDQLYNIAPNPFERIGYSFSGWNTAADGSGTAYAVGAQVRIEGDLVLYAQWTRVQYTVIFLDWNDDVLKTEAVEHGGAAKAPDNPDNKPGWYFVRWDPVDFSNITGDLTVKAQYEMIGIVDVVNAGFISIVETSKNSRVWVLTFSVTVKYSDGSSKVAVYSINLNGNNANLDGSYKFSSTHDLAGYTLIYNIKGNGSNIKAFNIRK